MIGSSPKSKYRKRNTANAASTETELHSKCKGSEYMSMNERERLLVILYAMPEAISLSEMADYLLEHGITAPPTEIDGKYEEKENIRRAIIEELNRIGGCDATDEWSKGWDAAVGEAIKIAETVPTVEIPKCAFCRKLIKEGKK